MKLFFENIAKCRNYKSKDTNTKKILVAIPHKCHHGFAPGQACGKKIAKNGRIQGAFFVPKIKPRTSCENRSVKIVCG